ncbi:alpha/beta fold hydrolase [Bacteroidota bacterium]
MITQAGEYNLTTVQQLQDPTYLYEINKLWFDGKEGTFQGAGNISIYYKTFLQPDEELGAIMISTGRTEAALKYKEVVFNLYNNGYSVYIFDHRGQGLSGRMTEDNEMGHVDDSKYYVEDMKKFFDLTMGKAAHKKRYLLSHSMGGAIGMRYIEKYPDDFAAAAFISPMLGLSAYICPLAKVFPNKAKYVPGYSGYSDDSTKFEGNDVTNCRIRYFQKIALYNEIKDARIGGASMQWLKESCKLMKRVGKYMDEIQIPILIFLAEDETVVNPKITEKFAEKASLKGKKCTLISIEDAKHELLMERDPQRSRVLLEIFSFYRLN